MSNVAMTLQERINLVRSAIERIRDAKARWLDCEADPASTGDDRWKAKQILGSREGDFYSQWSNVEVILQEGLREELR
jgi:hypothetical protein